MNRGDITVSFDGSKQFYEIISEIESHIYQIRVKMEELKDIRLSLEVALNSQSGNANPEPISTDQT